MLWIFVAAALAQDAVIFTDTLGSDEPERAARLLAPGRLGVEATVYEMGADLDDVTLVTADLQRGIEAPERAILESRAAAWRRAFGRDTLTVRQQRVTDGRVVAEYRSSEAGPDAAWETPDDRVCASGARGDARPVELRTWNDLQRPLAGESGPGTSLYWVDGEERRTALVYLAPGDSVTVVEVMEAPRRHPKRRIELQRDERRLEIREDERRQQVCVEG
jgi:hypothetical protein